MAQRVGSCLDGARIALIACGSYNPPTIMHLRMFESARNFLERRYRCHVIEGIISPVADCFGKPDLLDASHRYKMSQLAVESSSWIRAEAWECMQKSWTRTVVVLRHFQQIFDRKYGNEKVRLMLLCGGDVVDSFQKFTANGKPLWDPVDVADIIKDFGLIVLSRRDAHPLRTLNKLGYRDEALNAVVIYEDNVLPNAISSTRLREAIRRGESIRYCTTDSVVKYIEKHQLYTKGIPNQTI